MDLVNGFDGRYGWLSNYASCRLNWQGVTYKSAEAAFAAGKTLDKQQRLKIAAAASPGEAKRLGRKVALRPDWDRRWRYLVMREVLAAKFADPEFAKLLLGTGHALLVEKTTWCDNHWGCCSCNKHAAIPGKNVLGRFLMDQRTLLRPGDAQAWPFVACSGHRPQYLDPASHDWIRGELDRLAVKLAGEHGTKVGISGCAAGSDLWFASSVHRAGLKLWLYRPYPGPDERWPAQWRDEYAQAMLDADRVDTLSSEYDIALLQRRNEWMLRDCSALIAVVDPLRKTGGTVNALKTMEKTKPIIRVDVRRRLTTIKRPALTLFG